MGTLTEQPHRKYRVYDDEEVQTFIRQIKNTAKKNDLSVDQTLKVFELLEKERSNTIYVDNGNIWDEQIGGIGEIMQGIAHSLQELEGKD